MSEVPAAPGSIRRYLSRARPGRQERARGYLDADTNGGAPMAAGDDLLLTRAEAAERLRVSVQTVRRRADSGHLAEVQVSARAVRVRSASVGRLIREGLPRRRWVRHSRALTPHPAGLNRRQVPGERGCSYNPGSGSSSWGYGVDRKLRSLRCCLFHLVPGALG